MSSQSIPEDNGLKTSPAPGDDLDLHALLSERSGTTAKVAFWVGIVLGLWFILGAFEVHKGVSDAEEVADLLPTWHEWVWIGNAFIGLFVSFAVCSHLLAHRKPGDLPYDVLSAIGGAISLAIVVVILLEHVDSLHDLISPGGGVLWPMAKPLWFLPLSALCVTLPMIALVLARKGSLWDTGLGVFLSSAPLIAMSLPAIFDMDMDGLVRWIPTVYFVSGVGLVLAGFRPFERSLSITYHSVGYLAPRIFAGMLVFMGLLVWFMVSIDDPLSSDVDVVWIIPLMVNLALSVALIAALRNSWSDKASFTQGPRPKLDEESEFVIVASAVVSMMISVLLLSLFTLSYLDVTSSIAEDDPLYAFSLPRSVWLFPLSLLGTTLVMIGVGLSGAVTFYDRISGLLYASVPGVVATALAVGSAIMSEPEFAHPLLRSSEAALLYIGFAVAVIVSGMNIETFIKLQFPVLHEKSVMNGKRYRQIMRQVMRNVMGVIGVAILIVFVILAAVGPLIAPYEVDMTINGQFDRFMPQSPLHWMGTDSFGHDVLSQLLYGAKTSITVGIVAALISSFLGATIGLYSGYVGGWKDEAIMRMNDIVLSIPWLVLMIIIAAFMGSIDLTGIILVIGLTGWSGTARLVRAQVLSLRERQYIERARAIGSDDMHIIRKHILPNAFPLVFANTILTVAGSILAEATLSFLRLEPQGVVTWGTMLADAEEAGAFTIGMHWWIIAPGLCIVIVVLGFTLLGYALDDVMNPKLRKR